MSSSLYWKPVDDHGKALPDELKYKLRGRFGDPVNMVMDASNLEYLSGLKDCGIKGAWELICLIDKHGSISLREHH